jgi:nitrogen fixation NifU-like protein
MSEKSDDVRPFADHFRHRYHCAEPVNWTHKLTLSSSRCGDEVTLFALIREERVIEAWHTAIGCVVSVASASFLCHWVEERSTEYAKGISDSEFLALLTPLTPMRQECALLPLRCLRQLLGTDNDCR